MSKDIHFRSTYIDPKEAPIGYQRDALAYWQDKCAGRFAPAWTDISLLDFPSRVIPLINVTDIDPQTGTITYRFWGTGLTETHGHDYSGQSPLDLPPREFGDGARSGHQKLAREKAPNFEVKEFLDHRQLLGRQLLLRLPLSDDGETVNHSMTVSYFEWAAPNKPLAGFFAEVFGADR